jgi:hypothetical protein
VPTRCDEEESINASRFHGEVGGYMGGMGSFMGRMGVGMGGIGVDMGSVRCIFVYCIFPTC